MLALHERFLEIRGRRFISPDRSEILKWHHVLRLYEFRDSIEILEEAWQNRATLLNANFPNFTVQSVLYYAQRKRGRVLDRAVSDAVDSIPEDLRDSFFRGE